MQSLDFVGMLVVFEDASSPKTDIGSLIAVVEVDVIDLLDGLVQFMRIGSKRFLVDLMELMDFVDLATCN